MSDATYKTPRFAFAEYDQSGGESHPLAVGESVTLVSVERGSIMVLNDGASLDLGYPFCGIYIGSRSTAFTVPAGEAARIVACSAPIAGFPELGELRKVSGTPHRPTTDRIQTLFRLGNSLASEKSSPHLHLRDTIGEALFRAFIADIGISQSVTRPSCVKKAQDYLDQNFAQSCDLDRLAVTTGVRKEQLVAEFKRHLGITPVRYLWDMRTRMAAHLVETTSMTLIEIAVHTGYKSQFHLSREIKRLTGVSPRGLRRGNGSR